MHSIVAETTKEYTSGCSDDKIANIVASNTDTVTGGNNALRYSATRIFELFNNNNVFIGEKISASPARDIAR